ncbi:LysR family transcriptional regulator [Vibrio sp. 10N.261.55.A7]|uniref:LysR family transcriptional regulator n=1 Tax=Vibrio sp. 10N.261.55.A7 TaxID=1880851 RepID=UPI000C845A72|nr:LysR family transcriptional regulator [Vibrio sp. 10N.261.55.A7]PMJ91389.1 hypothetical protein BCU12_00930 [Vibrio sp. 10N.261.55.A7]
MITNDNDTHKLLPNLAVFRLVAKLGSFQAAANQMGLPRPSVSKKISQLEELVGQRLMQRTTRKLALTESGEDLLRITESLPSILNHVDDFISKQHAEPKGLVRISCSTLIGQRYLLSHVKSLMARFPQIRLELSFDDNNTDLLENKVDIAIRIGNLPDSPMVARAIGIKRWCFVASPDYIENMGTPSEPSQLKSHQCLVFKNNTTTHDCWQFKNSVGAMESINVEAAITSDDARALVEMLKSGLGIAMIDPNFIAEELASGELVKILTPFTTDETVPIQLVCLGRTTRSKASEAVWEELVTLLTPHFAQKNSAN